MRWVTTTNHKDIGTMYLWFSFTMFMVGGIMALVIRAELFKPGLQIVQPEFFNSMTTYHGLIMVFGAIMPAFVGFANWLIPMQIGAPDMAFPRLNNWSFWLLPPAATLLILAQFVPGGGAGVGWTLYPPLTIQQPMSMDLTIFAVHILGMSSILGSINIITTILNMRAPGMTLMKMPLFCWTWLITAYLLVAVMPVLAGAVTMLLTDRHFDTHFFNAAGGGDPVLFQHIFWFFGHPEVYIIAIPAFGVISQIIPAFSRKPLFGYSSMVYATASIAILSFLVWAHHMYTVGMPVQGQLYFMFATMLIAVPTGVKVFNWVATMWKGSLTFETPMLFACGFLFLFTLGGFTGLVLAIVPVDVQLHDTYYVVAHFHYVMVAGALFSAFGGIYFWLPKWTGKMYNETLGKWHFWLSFFFFNLTFFVQHFLGLAGHAAAHSRLRAAVRRLQHGLQHRRLRLRPVAAAVPLHRGEDHHQRQEGGRQAVGRRGQPGMDGAAQPAALPQLRNPAGGAVAPAWAPGVHGSQPQERAGAQSAHRSDAGHAGAGFRDRFRNPDVADVMSVAELNRVMLRKLLVVAVAMFGFGFALVPIYRRSARPPAIYDLEKPDEVRNTQVDEGRLVTIEFDANTRGLPWEFRPLQRSVQVHPGQLVQVLYEARNTAAMPVVGQAIASYGPQVAGQYVKKIECFCFTRQELKANETRQMPLQFVVDTRLPGDVTVITFSYTFFELPGGRPARRELAHGCTMSARGLPVRKSAARRATRCGQSPPCSARSSGSARARRATRISPASSRST